MKATERRRPPLHCHPERSMTVPGTVMRSRGTPLSERNQQRPREELLCTEKKKAAWLAAVLFTCAQNAGWVRGLLRAVLVCGDPFAHVVGFPIELPLIFLGEMAVPLRHIFLLVLLQALLAALEVGGLARRELCIFHAIGNPLLLVSFALIDLIDSRVSGIDVAGTGARGFAGLRLSRG